MPVRFDPASPTRLEGARRARATGPEARRLPEERPFQRSARGHQFGPLLRSPYCRRASRARYVRSWRRAYRPVRRASRSKAPRALFGWPTAPSARGGSHEYAAPRSGRRPGGDALL